MLGDDDLDSMWLCPECETWVGTELETCRRDHERPSIPVCSDDVDADWSKRMTRWDRYRVKLRKLVRWST